MLGRIFGALLGERIAKQHGEDGFKGALIGAAIPVIARRSVPALAAVAAAGWGFRKLRERRAARRSAEL